MFVKTGPLPACFVSFGLPCPTAHITQSRLPTPDQEGDFKKYQNESGLNWSLMADVQRIFVCLDMHRKLKEKRFQNRCKVPRGRDWLQGVQFQDYIGDGCSCGLEVSPCRLLARLFFIDLIRAGYTMRDLI